MADHMLFRRTLNFGATSSLQSFTSRVFVASPAQAQLEVWAGSLVVASLNDEQLDDVIDMLKGARRAMRDAKWKMSQQEQDATVARLRASKAEHNAAERQRAAQTDPEWAKRMMAPSQDMGVAPSQEEPETFAPTADYRPVLGATIGLERRWAGNAGTDDWRIVEPRDAVVRAARPEPRWPLGMDSPGAEDRAE